MFEQVQRELAVVAAEAPYQRLGVDEAIERAVGHGGGEAGDRVDRGDDEVAPPAEAFAPLAEEVLRALERGHRGRLADRRRVAAGVRLQPAHRLDEPGRAGGDADAEAGHGMALR